jgi:hypothetical protein
LKIKNILINEWKSLGISAYIPFLVYILLLFYCRLFRDDQRIIILALQAVLPVMSSWWVVLSFYNLVEEEGKEVFFSYPMNRWWIGIGRCLAFYILHMIITYILIIFCSVDSVNIINVFIQLAIQSFFFTGLSFMLVLLTQNTSVSIAIPFGYCTFELLSEGKILSFINIYNFKVQFQLAEISMNSNIIYILLLSLLFMSIGQALILNKFGIYIEGKR